MPPTFTDPVAAARAEAQAINRNRHLELDSMIDRVMADAPWVDRANLLAGLTAFHKERMAKVPSAAKYPEAKPWVEHRVALDRELKKQANLTDEQLAMRRSLGDYLTFRGFASAKPVMTEKCRVAYLPDTDHGQLHIKNVDDPATYWTGNMPVPAELPLNGAIVDDGVGSGLHVDDEPEEIFPLDARVMMPHYASDVPGAVEFFTRYKNFWGGCNVVVRDKQKRGVAIEKCSFNFIEVFYPGPDGRSHCSGMACRDPQSPQAKYQKARRDGYVKKFNLGAEAPDETFWAACDRAEKMLADGLARLGKVPKLDDVLKLFITPWPDGLNKDGSKLHPGQPVVEYTLLTHGSLLDQKKYFRWVRDGKTLKMPEEREVFEYA